MGSRKILVSALLLVGCAHGKMGHISQPLAKNAVSKGETIQVVTIKADSAQISGDKSGDAGRVESIKSEIAGRFNREIAEHLRRKGFKAVAVESMPSSGIVLAGKVTKIENGSAAARMLVGMGAGSANMFTDFKLMDAATQKLLGKFEIIATSGGNSGWQAAGSYLNAHIKDGAEKTAEYIAESN